MAADGSIIIDTRMDTSGVQNGVSAIRQSFNGLGSVVKKIGILIGGAFAIGKLAQFGKECVELGSNLAEVQNVVDVTFTTMSDKVNEFAKSAMTTAGLSETMAKQYVGTFGAILSMVVSIVVPVPFVQTSTRLLPTLLASFAIPDKAMFAASMVFLPSFFHASWNGFQSFLRRSASFFAESLILSSAVSPSARFP